MKAEGIVPAWIAWLPKEYWLFPDKPLLSLLAVYLIVAFVLWMARAQVERLLRALLVGAANLLRLAMRWLQLQAGALSARADELAVEYFLSELETKAQREYEKIEAIVHRDLAKYPELNQLVADKADDFDRLYRAAQEPVLPKRPDYAELARAIGADEGASGRRLHRVFKRSFAKHLRAAKKEARRRVRRLGKLRRPVRKMQKALHRAASAFEKLNAAVARIDDLMSKLVAYQQDRELALRAANHSVLTRFFVGLFFLVLTIGGSIVNFMLIQRPMAEMVGGGLIGGFSVSQFAALVIVSVELAAGVIFMEAWGLSHLLPFFQSLEPERRRMVMLLSGGLLVAMAGVEAGLAILREHLIAQDALVRAELAGGGELAGEVAEQLFSSLPVAVQATMGFVLPLILAFAAIPLDILFHTGRIVAQRVLAVLCWLCAGVLRIGAHLMRFFARTLHSFYELLIFPILFLERVVTGIVAIFGRRRVALQEE